MCAAGRLRAEVERVYNKVEPDGDNLGDFFAFAPQHTFIELVSRKPWPAISIDNRLPIQALVDEDGQLVRAAPVIGKNGKPKGDPDGDPVLLKPSVWLDQNRSINGITWAPGMPLIVFDKVIAESVGWIDAPGKATFNTYRAPVPEKCDPRKAGPWLKLVRKVYGRHARRIVQWFAYRVQRPDVKINHGLVFGGVPGIGKDTIIEGVREAVGGWNIRDASPLDMFEKYNGYAKAVLLRINESRDTGEQSQHAFYNKMKTYLAAPPPTLTVNEKYITHDDIPNVCGGIITTNYKETGLFLPPDDRRNYVQWSERQPGDFKPTDFQPRNFATQQANPTYWDWIWDWYETRNGYAHVAAYLRQLDISKFNAKAPPPKTEAFWAIVNANRSHEENELAEVLAIMGNLSAVTLSQILKAPMPSTKLQEWLNDSRNRRVIPKHMKTAGYESVHNPDNANGLDRRGKRRQQAGHHHAHGRLLQHAARDERGGHTA
jgi:hypothetical protein